MTFLELLLVKGIPWRKHAKPAEVWLNCPFCQDDKFRLGLNWQKNMAHCFNGGCGWKSRKAIQNVLRAWKLEVRVNSPEGEEALEKPPEPIHLPDDFLPLHQIARDEEPPFVDARRYWRRRGFSLAQAKANRIGASFCGRYAFRIIMPVIYQGKLKGLVTRAWADQEPKYLNSSGERFIWGMRKARGDEPLLLAEGIFKALALQIAFPAFHCAALLGHSLTAGQVAQIEECGHAKIVLWPDPDRPGLEGILSVAEQLVDAGLSVHLPIIIPTQQADEYPPPTLQEIGSSVLPFNPLTRRRYQMEALKR